MGLGSSQPETELLPPAPTPPFGSLYSPHPFFSPAVEVSSVSGNLLLCATLAVTGTYIPQGTVGGVASASPVPGLLLAGTEAADL